LNEIGRITIYKDNEGIRLKLDLDQALSVTQSGRLDGIEGSGETLTEALEDLYISADLIGE
jgi:hypothetical protein